MAEFFCLTTQDTSYCPECERHHGACLNCGGWLHREKIGGYDGQHCDQECAEEAAAFQAREKARWASNWCPTCGFDNWEHADDCAHNEQTAEARNAEQSDGPDSISGSPQ